MHEKPISSVSDYLDKLNYYANPYWLYRGHADINWKLIPSAGRPEYYTDKMQKQRNKDGFPPFDLSRFELWKNSAIAYRKDLPTNDFECLALAQHFGLATRLMDWTSNPLVALFFAVESCSDVEGCIYIYSPHIVLDHNILKLNDPKIVCNFMPPPLDNRILAQQGSFTYHPNPNEEMMPEDLQEDKQDLEFYPHNSNLIRFLILPKLKSRIKRQLDNIGLNRKYLFADLDGLSNYINAGTAEAIDANSELG